MMLIYHLCKHTQIPMRVLVFPGYIPALVEMISTPPLLPLLSSHASPFALGVQSCHSAHCLPQVPATWTIIRPLCVLFPSSLSPIPPSFYHFPPEQFLTLALYFLFSAVSSIQCVTDVPHALGSRVTVQRVYETSTSWSRGDTPSIVDDKSSRSPSVKLEHLFEMPSCGCVCVGVCVFEQKEKKKGEQEVCG